MFFATAAKGLEPLLADELTALGATNVQQTRAGVSFSGGLGVAYRACLWSRLASRIIMRIAEVDAQSSDALYDAVRGIRWSDHLDSGGTMAVDFTSHASEAVHTRFGAQRVKDAVVDRLRDDTGTRPSVDVARPDVRVNVYLEAGRASVGIDLSGESLHRRGYRDGNVPAPIKENLAAAVLLRAAPTLDTPLVDPMCGSGTLLIEGGMLLGDVAPGLLRDYFGFLRWRGHEADAWKWLIEEAKVRRAEGIPKLPPIVGFEPDPRSAKLAAQGAHAAGLGKHIRIERATLSTLTHELVPGLVVVNPPYGVRLGDEEGRSLASLYEELGNVLKTKFPGWRAAALTAKDEIAGAMRLRADKRYSFFNGSIPCWLFVYTLAETPRSFRISEGETAFANRLKKNLDKLGKWAKGAGVECYRLYDGDIPEYALAVDRYGKLVHVQEYAPPKTIDPRMAQRRLREALHAIPEALGVSGDDVFVKVRKQQKGDAQYERHDSEGRIVTVREGGHSFIVNLSDYLDTGLFLDHRLTRKLIGEMAQGKSFLNLFAYTCTVSVYAARGGATSTVSVDTSRTYLAWAEKNFRLNSLSERSNRLVQEDALAWLAEARERFDLIFVDPPTFSNSKDRAHDFDVQRDHVELLVGCSKLLNPGGQIVFSNNFRRFKLAEAELDFHGLAARDITKSTIPKDFERNPRIHQCFVLSRSE
ncbi:MAG: bifunctional 23S rRNA (guanine(2069)-N(7))-methyltransferase RlmK/23S rRNA (guanine(2445)-N(2))-methyltransferase RlmL [Myxococcota bacterium]